MNIILKACVLYLSLSFFNSTALFANSPDPYGPCPNYVKTCKDFLGSCYELEHCAVEERDESNQCPLRCAHPSVSCASQNSNDFGLFFVLGSFILFLSIYHKRKKRTNTVIE